MAHEALYPGVTREGSRQTSRSGVSRGCLAGTVGIFTYCQAARRGFPGAAFVANIATMNILFVCLGNICRSPTAEGVVRAVAAREFPELKLALDSAGTADY